MTKELITQLRDPQNFGLIHPRYFLLVADALEAAQAVPVELEKHEPIGRVESAAFGAGGFHVYLYPNQHMPKVGTNLYAAPTPPLREPLTNDDVRAAGGIVHKDGNIFFTNIDKLNAAIKAAPLREPLSEDKVTELANGFHLRPRDLVRAVEAAIKEQK